MSRPSRADARGGSRVGSCPAAVSADFTALFFPSLLPMMLRGGLPAAGSGARRDPSPSPPADSGRRGVCTGRVMNWLRDGGGGGRAEKHMDSFSPFCLQSFLPSPNFSLRHAGATPIYVRHRVVLLGCFLPLACNDLVDRTVMRLNYRLNPPKEEAN